MRRDPLAFLGIELDSLKQQGLFRQLRILEGEQSHKTTFDGRQVVNLSSNNYLGLTTHPRLREAALESVRRLGVGSGSVRTIAGTMDIHMELERRLAAFKKTEAVVVFQSGFAANAGTVAAVLTKDDVVDFRRAESREHHRRLPPEPRHDQGVPAQGRRRRAQDPAGTAGQPAQAAHHRRRLQHGRRPRRAARAVRAGRGIRLHHDGRRCPRERRVREERPRHDRSLRHARPRRHPGRHAVEGDRRARRLRRRQPSRSSSSCITARGRFSSRRRIRRRWPRRASRRSTSSSRSRRSSSGCGTTRASSRPA